MYAKLFTSIYAGTLRGNSHGLLVFTNLLAHADQQGIADIHPRAIAEEVGLTQEQVRAALDLLEAPDVESRSPSHDGRRLLRTDTHRAWGWQIVNYLKYRAIRNEEDRREQNRIAQSRFREKSKPTSAEGQPSKPASAASETGKPIQKEKEKEKEEENIMLTHDPAQPPVEQQPAESDVQRIPDCPHAEILALWAEVLPSMPQHLPKMWRGTRAAHLKARWREMAAEKRWATDDEGLAFFRRFFAYCGNSEFLTGRSPPRPGGRPFVIELEWLVNPTNWAKVHEGKYHQED